MIRPEVARRPVHWGQTVAGGPGRCPGGGRFPGAVCLRSSPTGSNSSAKSCGFLPEDAAAHASPIPAPIPDYELKLPGLDHVKLATAAAGLVGTLVVFGVAWGMARILPRRQNEEATSHAA